MASSCRRNMSRLDYQKRLWAALAMGAKRRRYSCRCDYCMSRRGRRRTGNKQAAIRFEERAG